MKNNTAISLAPTPNRSWKKYASSAVVRNPPATLSIANRPEIFARVRRLSGERSVGRVVRADSIAGLSFAYATRGTAHSSA
jgi:hypothetical protein